jgi:hypothetical protein
MKIEDYQCRSIFEARQPARIMQEPFETIMVYVVFHFGEKTTDQVSDKYHFGLQCTQN